MTDLLERVKKENPLREKIEEYATPAEENGTIVRYHCPLPGHTDKKDPSFVYYKEQNNAYCYGCNRYIGNAVDFVKFFEGIEFKEALKQLAIDSGIKINRNNDKIYKRNKKIRKRVEELTNKYRKKLKSNGQVMRYLKEDRGLNEKTINEFELGYCDTIEKKALRKFKNRIVLPIKDKYDRYTALAGRILPEYEDNELKYMNSSKKEIPFFKKDEIIFNFNKAKKHIAKEGYAIWTEGYFDVILLWQYGIKNVVASMGTAITDKQIEQVSKIADSVVPFLDPDESGKKALIKALDKFENSGVRVSIVRNKYDKDPAELALKYKNNLENFIKENIITVEQYFTEEILSKYRKKVIDAKREAINSLKIIFKNRMDKEETQYVLEDICKTLGIENVNIIRDKIKEEENGKR